MNMNAKLATAFALGAAITAGFAKVRARRHRTLTFKPGSDNPANTDYTNTERYRHFPGNALEPLDTEVLVRRSIEAFPAGYLLLISIIQSVALGILLTQTVTVLNRPESAIEVIAIVSEAATLFGALVIISYEYLWFVVMMRWASTFRDTLIPYAIGVCEIIPSLIIGKSLPWWIAATVVPVICGAALFNTITRLDLRAFVDKPAIYQTVRLLLWRIIICCGAITAIGVIGSILIARGALHGIVLSLAPIALILPAFVAVGINEKSLNYVFEDYGISRRPWPRQHRA